MRVSVKPLRAGIEIAANIAIVVVALLLVANFVWSRWHLKSNVGKPIIGTKVSLEGSRWDDGPTLVLALQKGCRYCEESATFYRRLRNQTSGSKVRLIAVIPGDQTEITKYLSELGIIVDGILNASLSDINVSATPTLFIVDRSGIVKDVWVGKLDARKETEVVQRIISP